MNLTQALRCIRDDGDLHNMPGYHPPRDVEKPILRPIYQELLKRGWIRKLSRNAAAFWELTSAGKAMAGTVEEAKR